MAEEWTDEVVGVEVAVPTAVGTMSSLVMRPADDDAHPLVVSLMDAHGRRPELAQMAARLAAAGYCVVQPDLYYRDAPMYRLDPDDPQSIARVQQLIGRTTTANVRSDVADVLRWADDSGWTRGSAVGCVGYCFSGPFAVDVANSFPDRIRAAACFHGVRLHTDRPDSPHLALSNAGAEFYVGAAEHDEYAPAEMIERLATAMAAAGVRHRIEWYANTEHGFVFPRRPAYDARAAERHWERLLDLFARTLTHVSQ